MAQKVQFISTVMHEPKLIILDEPFSGFDPVNAQIITHEILDLKKKDVRLSSPLTAWKLSKIFAITLRLIDKSKKILEGSKKQVKETYRSNTYWVEHKGLFNLSSAKL